MKVQIEFSVYRPGDSLGKRICEFARLVEIDSSISVPYEQISSSLRFLYGNDVIITIEQKPIL